MTNLLLDMTDLEDMKANFGFATSFIDKLADEANKVLLQGGEVIVERRYTNAPPDRLHTITSVEAFTTFWGSIFANSGE